MPIIFIDVNTNAEIFGLKKIEDSHAIFSYFVSHVPTHKTSDSEINNIYDSYDLNPFVLPREGERIVLDEHTWLVVRVIHYPQTNTIKVVCTGNGRVPYGY